jgi:ATP synthase protein I
LPEDPKKFKLFDYKKNRVWSDGLSFVMQIGLTMTGSILFCFFVGLYLDKWLGTRGVFTTVFILLGIAGGAYTAYRQIQDTMEKDKRRQQRDASETRDGKH